MWKEEREGWKGEMNYKRRGQRKGMMRERRVLVYKMES